MFKHLILLLVVGAVSFGQSAQTPQGVAGTRPPGVRHPGEVLTYTVTFASAFTPSSVVLEFELADSVDPSQMGMCRDLPLQLSAPTTTQPGTTFNVTGTIPKCASGTYQLKEIVVGIPNIGEKHFQYPSDFEDDIQFKLVDVTKNAFPAVKSVTPK
jgi:hypothetical protein